MPPAVARPQSTQRLSLSIELQQRLRCDVQCNPVSTSWSALESPIERAQRLCCTGFARGFQRVIIFSACPASPEGSITPRIALLFDIGLPRGAFFCLGITLMPECCVAHLPKVMTYYVFGGVPAPESAQEKASRNVDGLGVLSHGPRSPVWCQVLDI
jgi:hypothetical protein